MNPQLSKHNTVSCPICSRDHLKQSDLLSHGLLLCSRCHGRLVVSPSGTYVRDPFASPPVLDIKQVLQRQRKVSQLQSQTWDPQPETSGWKFLTGFVIVLLLWAGLYRLSSMSNVLKTPTSLPETSVLHESPTQSQSQTPNNH